jgi:hypothetical protein
MGFAEPVIGPATSGRTRWFNPSYGLRAKERAFGLDGKTGKGQILVMIELRGKLETKASQGTVVTG